MASRVAHEVTEAQETGLRNCLHAAYPSRFLCLVYTHEKEVRTIAQNGRLEFAGPQRAAARIGILAEDGSGSRFASAAWATLLRIFQVRPMDGYRVCTTGCSMVCSTFQRAQVAKVHRSVLQHTPYPTSSQMHAALATAKFNAASNLDAFGSLNRLPLGHKPEWQKDHSGLSESQKTSDSSGGSSAFGIALRTTS